MMTKHLYCAIRNGNLVDVARRKQYLVAPRDCIKVPKTVAIKHHGISRIVIENWMKVKHVNFYLHKF